MPEETPKPEIHSTRTFSIVRVLTVVVVVSVILAAALFAVLWFFGRKEDNPPAQTNTTTEASRSASKSASQQAFVTPSKDWIEFVNTEYNYSLRHPKNYQVDRGLKPAETAPSISIFFGLENNLYLAVKEKSKFSRIIDSGERISDFSKLSVKEITEQLRADVPRENNLSEALTEVEEESVGGRKSYFYDYREKVNPDLTKDGPGPISRRLVMELSQTRLIVIDFTPNSVYQEILSTFEFL